MSTNGKPTEPPDFLGFAEQVAIPFATGPAPMGQRMAPFQREFFAAIAPALRAVCLSQAVEQRKFWVERTKGASKDTDATLCILYVLAFAKGYARIRVGAYKQDQADEVRQIARQILAIDHPLNRVLDSLLEVQSDRIIRRSDGSVCEILTSDNRGTHGGRPNMVLLNEATHVGDEEFAATLLDDADKVPTCVTLVCTNAGYYDTWQWRWRQLAVESWRWQTFIYTDSAPWLDPADFAESKRRNSVTRHNRLRCGVWASGIGDALDADDIRAAVRDNTYPPFPGPSLEGRWGFVGGMDLGVRSDHSSLCILAMEVITQRVKVAHTQSWKPGDDGQVDLIDVQGTALSLSRDFCNCPFYYDPSQAELMAQQLRRAGVRMEPVPFVGKNLDLMANTLLQAFRNRTIDLYSAALGTADLIRDLGRLSIVERGFGYKLEAPKDRKAGHCDRAFAMAIALPFASEAMSTMHTYDPWILLPEYV